MQSEAAVQVPPPLSDSSTTLSTDSLNHVNWAAYEPVLPDPSEFTVL